MRKNLSESVSLRTRDLPLQDAIERRAYELWEREGHPEGRDIEHWLTAERQIADAAPHTFDPDADPARSPELAADLPGRRRDRTSARRASSTLSAQ